MCRLLIHKNNIIGKKFINDVWIGYNATIMAGVSIGDGSIMAANSTVVKDVEKDSTEDKTKFSRVDSRDKAKPVKSRKYDESQSSGKHLQPYVLLPILKSKRCFRCSRKPTLPRQARTKHPD